MERDLEGRRALVTGSTSGIGLGIALALARRGARVAINGLGEPGQIDRARDAVSEAAEGEVPFLAADLSDPREVRKMCLGAAEALGGVDVLVNNAGIQHTSPVESFPEEKWDAILAINLSAVFHATRAVLPGMREAGWGRIVNVASVHGLVASPCKSAYVAAKHGVVGFTRSVALEVARSRVTCNAVCPGFVRTPMAERQVAALAEEHGVSEDEALTDHLLAKQPSKRWVEVEEVAEAVLHLCSPRSGGVNGATLTVDGGWVAA